MAPPAGGPSTREVHLQLAVVYCIGLAALYLVGARSTVDPATLPQGFFNTLIRWEARAGLFGDDMPGYVALGLGYLRFAVGAVIGLLGGLMSVVTGCESRSGGRCGCGHLCALLMMPGAGLLGGVVTYGVLRGWCSISFSAALAFAASRVCAYAADTREKRKEA